MWVLRNVAGKASESKIKFRINIISSRKISTQLIAPFNDMALIHFI